MVASKSNTLEEIAITAEPSPSVVIRPNTSGAKLRKMAQQNHQLWPQIAAHPNAFPALLDWMAQYGDDEVRRVIASLDETTLRNASTRALGATKWGRSPQSRIPLLQLVTSIAMLVVILISGSLPFAARSMALGAVSTGSDGGTNTQASYDPALPAELGVRTLPLLTDVAKTAWATDPYEAFEDAGTKLFGADAWVTFTDSMWSSAVYLEQAWESASLDPSYDWQWPGQLAEQAVSSSIESDVLDVVGLAEMMATEDDSDIVYYSMIAASLTMMSTQRFHSCDSALALAHIAAMIDHSDGASDEQYRNDPTIQWTGAITACPDDPTVAVEYSRWKLASSFHGGATLEGHYLNELKQQGWQPIAADLDALVSQFPKVAAAQLVAGDGYRWLAANAAEATGTGPFTIAEFQSRAITAYQAALGLTSMPDTVASLATTLVAAGRANDALSYIEQVPSTGVTARIRAAKTQTLAHIHDYAAAIDAHNQPTTATTAPEPILAPSGYADDTLTSGSGTQFANLYLGGNYGGADTGVESFGFTPQYRYCPSEWDFVDRLQSLIDTVSLSGQAIGTLSDLRIDGIQDTLRCYGDYAAAEQVLSTYVANASESSLAWERLGEVYFLQQQWQESAQASSHASYQSTSFLDLWNQGQEEGEGSLFTLTLTGPGWAMIRKAVAERQLADYSLAATDLDGAIKAQKAFESDWEDDLPDARLQMYVLQEHGQLSFAQYDFPAALDYMIQSIEARVTADEQTRGYTSGEMYVSSVRGAQEQIASMAARQLGQNELAISWAQKAVDADPFSPLYAETLAEAQRAAGGTETPEASNPSSDADKLALIDSYRHTLELDPSLFSSWNNMGVLLAQTGQPDAALDAFKRAIQARPDYPTGWFNLGVAWAQGSSFTNFLRSQGALGQAGKFDHKLKQQAPVFRFDEEVYQSGLDVSKPIPPDWLLPQSVRSRPGVLTVGLFILLALRLLGQVGRDQALTLASQRLLSRTQQKSSFSTITRLASWRPHWAITTVISFAALTYVTGGRGPWEIGFGMIVCAALLVAHMVAPSLVIRLNQPTTQPHHVSFLPASLITIITAPFGLGFAPPAPLQETNDDGPLNMYRAGITTIAAAGVLYAVAAWFTGVPTAHATAMMTLILIASAFLPIKPLDGSNLKLHRWVNWTLTAVMLGITVLFALKII